MTKLSGVHPELVKKIRLVLAKLAVRGFLMKVTQGVRTLAQQQALYAQGRSSPGKIVTWCDGIRKPSNHQVKADGYGHAVDCVFMEHGKPSWREDLPWALYGELAKAEGLKWGGDWPAKRRDRPHVEL